MPGRLVLGALHLGEHRNEEVVIQSIVPKAANRLVGNRIKVITDHNFVAARVVLPHTSGELNVARLDIRVENTGTDAGLFQGSITLVEGVKPILVVPYTVFLVNVGRPPEN